MWQSNPMEYEHMCSYLLCNLAHSHKIKFKPQKLSGLISNKINSEHTLALLFVFDFFLLQPHRTFWNWMNVAQIANQYRCMFSQRVHTLNWKKCETNNEQECSHEWWFRRLKFRAENQRLLYHRFFDVYFISPSMFSNIADYYYYIDLKTDFFYTLAYGLSTITYQTYSCEK